MRIAVIGTPGAWSTERLADAFRQTGADAVVVDLDACSVRPPDPRVFHRGEGLAGLDGRSSRRSATRRAAGPCRSACTCSASSRRAACRS